VFERTGNSGVTLRAARAEEIPAILAFEQREFPNWHPYFREMTEAGVHEDVLAAWDDQGEVVGTLLTFTHHTPGAERDRLWTSLLGEEMGGLGAVGVSKTLRGQGIGLALVAKATEMLRERGVGNSHIGWTWLIDFYGRLGYRPWRTYEMSWREL
jgi:beta-N-acetylhexosaminidase